MLLNQPLISPNTRLFLTQHSTQQKTELYATVWTLLNQSLSLYLITEMNFSPYKASLTKLRTEREGFEPSTEVTSCNSLAGSRFQPLSHLSIANTLSSQRSKNLYCDPLQILSDHSRKSISETAKNFPWN